jgi:hypothetical protein
MLKKIRPLFNLRSRLDDIPRDWMKLVEPRIVRPADTACWLWDGALDRDGEPVLHITTPKGTRTMRRVKRIVAAMFWTLEDAHDVVHHCGTGNCLNPNHFYVSAAHWKQEDRKGMVRKRREGATT